MKSSVIALTALAVIGFSGAALAGQAKPAAMSDAEMDKVTAGAPGSNGNDNYLNGNANGAGGLGNGHGQGWFRNDQSGNGRF